MGEFYFKPGGLIANYKVFEQINVGVFKQVYRVQDNQSDSKHPDDYALKLFILPHHVDSDPGVKSLMSISAADFQNASDETSQIAQKTSLLANPFG